MKGLRERFARSRRRRATNPSRGPSTREGVVPQGVQHTPQASPVAMRTRNTATTGRRLRIRSAQRSPSGPPRTGPITTPNPRTAFRNPKRRGRRPAIGMSVRQATTEPAASGPRWRGRRTASRNETRRPGTGGPRPCSTNASQGVAPVASTALGRGPPRAGRADRGLRADQGSRTREQPRSSAAQGRPPGEADQEHAHDRAQAPAHAGVAVAGHRKAEDRGPCSTGGRTPRAPRPRTPTAAPP